MLFVSSGAKTLTGYSREEFVGRQRRPYADIIHVDDRERVLQEIGHAIASDVGYVLAYRIVTSSGSIKFVTEHGSAIRCPEGRVLSLQGFVADVTDAWQIREALDEAMERFRWIANATSDNIWEWDLRTNQVWHGPNTRKIFALPSDETRTGTECWLDLVHPEDSVRVLSSLVTAVAGTESTWSAQYRLMRIDGTHADVLDRAHILRDANNTAKRIVGGMSDLTEHKRSKAHLERLDRALRLMKQCNENLLRAADEDSLVNAICHVLVRTGGYTAVFIDRVPDSAVQSEQGSKCLGLDEARGCLTSSSSSEDLADIVSAAGVLAVGRPVICNEIASDIANPDRRDRLFAKGYRSGIWLPLTHDGQNLGVISIFGSLAARFDTEEVQLLQTLADNIAFGIENIRSHEQRRRIESAAVKIVAGVSASANGSFFFQLARNLALAVGADGAFVARFKDDGMLSSETVTAVLDNEAAPNFTYEIAGSPCEKLITSTRCAVLSDVAACFPTSGAAQMGMRGYAGCRLDSVAGHPLGLLYVLFRGQVVHPNFVTQIIQMFAARAGAELERQLADARIFEQASLLDKAKDGIVVHDASKRVTFWNQGAARLFGLPADKVLGESVLEILYDDVNQSKQIWASLSEQGQWQGEKTLKRKDGQELALEVNSTLVRDDSGQPGSVLSIVTDVTRRKIAENHVVKLAFYDRLTGLANRTLLENELHAFLDSGSLGAQEGALLWLDLDRLKSLNDTRGHGVGDELLRQTSTRILACIASEDLAARFGGDEFVVLIKSLRGDPESAVTTAKRLLKSLNEPYELDDYVHRGSASIGIAYFRCGQDAVTEILKRADIAMYDAKAAGRNTVRLFDTQMQRTVELRAELEVALRSALQQNALHIAYQPQVEENGQVIGVEALLRWNDPNRGLVSPAEFIPVAETSGLILQCGAWVLQQACEQLAHWQGDANMRSLSIAVNVSAHQIRHPSFVDQVKDALLRTGADPRKLKLELTESSLVTDTESTVEKMKNLKAIGVSFSLDDFGTGFSSLSYLRRLPLDQLKIDRSFISEVVEDPNAAVITRSIIALAKSLSLDVIAEGVETECQLRFLAMHGCTVYQGYLFSKPVEIDRLEVYLRQQANRSLAA